MKKRLKLNIDKSELSNPPQDVEDLQEAELSGKDKHRDLEESETDEDEGEGLGDGNLGKDDPDILHK
jgi:hypothetical protein